MTDGWRDDLSSRVRRLGTALGDETNWSGDSSGGPPKSALAPMAVVELPMHGWDLARATGQALDLPDEVATSLREVADRVGPVGVDQGAFGPAVALPADDPDDPDELGRAPSRPPGATPGGRLRADPTRARPPLPPRHGRVPPGFSARSPTSPPRRGARRTAG